MLRASDLIDLKNSVQAEIARYQINSTYRVKSDRSIVTAVDLFVSEYIKTNILPNFPDYIFYCEEDKPDKLQFPCIILDPIDGTKELSKSVSECAVSFSVFHSQALDDVKNFSWIYNPFTGFEINSDLVRDESCVISILNTILVSNTEYNNQNFIKNDNLKFLPIGSIAYKLGLLAAGLGDAVLTKRPKNIWDIAAGTHILFKNNIFMYEKKRLILSLDKELYDAPIVWCSKKRDVTTISDL